jgi:hypothetical protein
MSFDWKKLRLRAGSVAGSGSSGRLAIAVWYSGKVSSRIKREGWCVVSAYACACLVKVGAVGLSGLDRVTWEVL